MHDISNAVAVSTQLVHLQPCMHVCYVTHMRLEAPHVAETQCQSCLEVVHVTPHVPSSS